VAANNAGALLTAQVPEPSVDLATLIEYLADSIPPTEGAAPECWPLLSWSSEERVLGVNTFGVLRRLRGPAQTRKVLSGQFIANAPVPRSAQRSHLGGRLAPDSEVRLRSSVEELVRGIDQEIDRVEQSGLDPRSLTTTDAKTILDRIARQLHFSIEDQLQGPTRIARTQITGVADSQRARQDEVGRYLAAIEQVDGTRDSQIDNFLAAIETLLRQAGYPDIMVRAALAQHRQLAGETGKQLNRFFDFLDNEALSRVRLQIGNRMMDAIAVEAAARDQEHPNANLRLLVAYVRRASGLLDAINKDGLPLNLSAVYGTQADFDLRDHTRTAGFVYCLPVWPAWMTQMFEEQLGRASSHDGRTIRELTYRFRVNGDVPESPGDSAYSYRLQRIERLWLRLAGEQDDIPAQRVARSLAELVFLWAAIPTDEHTPASAEDAVETANTLIARLEQGKRPALVEVFGELRQRASIIDRVSDGLKYLMKAEGTVLTRNSLGRTWTYYVNVLRNVIDMQRVANSEHALVCSTSPKQEQIDFLEHIRITSDHGIRDALLSIEVRVRLSEYSLHLSGERETIDMFRSRPKHLTQVVWLPYKLVEGDPLQWAPALSGKDEPWLVPGRIEVQYSPVSLRWPPNKAKTPEGLQLLAATRAAMAVLVYATLWRLLQRGAPARDARPSVSVLRIQQMGREADAFSGEESVYAASQAIEMLLGRDADLRMQGIVLDDKPANRYKDRGAYAAMFAGFPLRIGQPEKERPIVGVISFAARPVNDHPDLPDVPGQQLVLARTYLARPADTPFRGYEVCCSTSRTEIIEPDESLPPMVDAEISRLYAEEQCRHIILLQHRFGQRRVGSHAAHSRLRHQDRLLGELAPRYPDAVIYPLVRDTFAATRLRSRKIGTEDAFEILRPDEHVIDTTEEGRILRRNYTPVYSLATLHIVGGAGAELDKPQSGFCTYFLLRDNLAPVEVVERLGANLLLSTSSVRESLIAVLRSIHYLEAERSIGPKFVQPVLDPYDWMAPTNTGKVGEVTVFESTRTAHGSVSLSLTALLHLVSKVLHALPSAGAAS
jgi:hypothetical protein